MENKDLNYEYFHRELVDIARDFAERFYKENHFISDVKCLELAEKFSVEVIVGYDDYEIKPYLFPLSSMTEEQDKEFALLQTSAGQEGFLYVCNCANMVKWLVENHFDYNCLIEKGLALDATNLNIY